MNPKPRPSFIRHWRELEPAAQVKPPIMDEAFGYQAELGSATGLSRLRVGHLRLPPGTRSHPPIAARDQEAFYFVLEGTPDLWADGFLHRLGEGDGVALNDRTGIGYSFLNNTESDVRLFMTGEAMRHGAKFIHPQESNRAANENLKKMGMYWQDAPARKLGPHDGLTETGRGHADGTGARKRGKPSFAAHWRDILDKKSLTYPNSTEQHGIDALFGRRARFSRLGVHIELLKPGRRTSWPHAERDEEESVFVVSGHVEAWVDGYIHPMGEGDFVGFEDKTGIAHVIINNSNEDAVLIVGGEASRQNNQFFYPFHTKRNKEVGALYWADHPKRKLGPHDGMPDALRLQVTAPKAKKRARR